MEKCKAINFNVIIKLSLKIMKLLKNYTIDKILLKIYTEKVSRY